MKVGWWLLALASGLFACGPRSGPAGPARASVQVSVAPNARLSEVRTALDQVAGARFCAFTWGRVPRTPPTSVPAITILFGTKDVFTGWLFCEDELEAVTSEPSVREDAMVFWQDGGLRTSYGTAAGESVALGARPHGKHPVRGYAAFVPGEHDPAVSELLPHLRDDVPRAFRFALMFVGEDRD